MFDSSHTRGEPISLPVNGVIRGWTMSLTHMTEGQLRRVWIPEELAYAGAEGRPAGMLVFDIELVAIE
jgi:FKBP-type peptidyl-prolyl cis-trans isomerase